MTYSVERVCGGGRVFVYIFVHASVIMIRRYVCLSGHWPPSVKMLSFSVSYIMVCVIIDRVMYLWTYKRLTRVQPLSATLLPAPRYEAILSFILLSACPKIVML